MIGHFREFLKFRELLFALSIREIKVRYKQTLLGAMWAIIQPLSLMIIFTFVFSFFLKIESEGVPYLIFSYSALLPWTFFATSLSFGSLAIINNGNLITKIYFPRETLPFSSLIAAFLDFLIASFLFIGMFFLFRTPLTFNIIFVFPIIILEVIFASAVILFTSALNVLWRDIKFVVPLAIQLWMFASPIIYPVSRVPDKYLALYMLNPMAVVVDNFRRVTILGLSPHWNDMIIAFVISLLLFILSYKFFKDKEKLFADII